ncbi:MAG: hypothetical protein LBG83_00675 [Oscillospiraceae bacterium]|jgi:hypothetical protein|nr:hypothetical protein [Oscillospiraceae bacterium]
MMDVSGCGIGGFGKGLLGASVLGLGGAAGLAGLGLIAGSNNCCEASRPRYKQVTTYQEVTAYKPQTTYKPVTVYRPETTYVPYKTCKPVTTCVEVPQAPRCNKPHGPTCCCSICCCE